MNIRAFRKQQGWSQAEMGRRIGEILAVSPITKATVSGWERGDRMQPQHAKAYIALSGGEVSWTDIYGPLPEAAADAA